MAEEIKIQEVVEEKKIETENQEVSEQIDSQPEEKKQEKKGRTAILFLNTTRNNTIITLTDMTGNTLARSSGGQSTKQSRLKSSPTVAMFATKKISEEAKEAGITDLYIKVKAETGSTSPGSASHAVVKSLGRDGFRIINIMDMTKNARGGPKLPGGRRGRRV